jgi:uncharacterized protein
MPSKPWYHKGLRFECTRCGNCCRNHGDYTHVYLTERDLADIPAHLGLTRGEFLSRYCATEDGWTVLRMDQPACPFLEEDNQCGIYPVRPKQCASWPFWTENLARAAWEGPVKDCCPGIGKGPLHPREQIEHTAAETDRWYDA